MALGADDSGTFRVSAAGAGANREIRLPPSAPPVTAAQSVNTQVSPSESKDPLEIKPAANQSIRVTGLPPVQAAIPGSDARTTADRKENSKPNPGPTPVVSPPRAASVEAWVQLPSGSHVALRYERWARRVSVSARKLEFPAQCPCCMQAADAEFEARVAVVRKRQTAISWTFPYCAICLEHARRARWVRYGARALGVVAALVLAGAGYWIGGFIAAAIAGTIAGLAAWLPAERYFLRHVAARMSSSCTCFGPAVRYAEFYGSVHHFDFTNIAYADAFKRANEKKLV
jgi:hypothetical protein